MTMYDDIQRYWHEMTCTMQAMPFRQLERVAEMLLDCHRRDRTIFLLGNGGSASTASHFACDLTKGTRNRGVAAFRVISLNDNMSLVTAWANDTSYEYVFAEQLAALVRQGDSVIIISASGNSPNVLAAAREALQRDADVIALTGASGGKLAQLAGMTICVPSDAIEQVEDAHLMIAHSLCVVLREQLSSQVAFLADEQAVMHARLIKPVGLESA